MNKKLLLSSVTASLILIGCGGGGGENEINNASKVMQKAYYIDSPVENLDYKCGEITGVTGKDGEFTFNKTTQCDFFIGGKKLNSFMPIVNGEKLFVNDGKVAKFLLSLDEDNNASNGILISDSIKKEVKSLAKDDFSDILTDLKEKGLIKKIYSDDEVLEHLKDTTKKYFKVLQGKTLYFLATDTQSDTPVYRILEIKFNNDLTKATMGEKDYFIKFIGAGRIQLYDNSDNNFNFLDLDFVKSTNKKIVFKMFSLNSTCEFYFYKSDAQKVLNSNSSATDFKPIPITLNMLDEYKITYKNGSAYITFDDLGVSLVDGKEKGDGPVIIRNGNTLVVWPGQPYEYQIQFGGLPKVGTTIKVVKEGGKDSYFTTITDIEKQDLWEDF